MMKSTLMLDRKLNQAIPRLGRLRSVVGKSHVEGSPLVLPRRQAVDGTMSNFILDKRNNPERFK